MKVSSLVFALLLASTPVLMSGAAYADCGGSSCKSEDPPPLDQSAPSAARSTASAVFAGTCGSSGCKSEDPPPLDHSAPPAASRSAAPAPNRSAPVGLLTPEPTADTCGGSGCKDDSDDNVGTDDIDDNTGTASGRRKALPPEIVRDGCSGPSC